MSKISDILGDPHYSRTTQVNPCCTACSYESEKPLTETEEIHPSVNKMVNHPKHYQSKSGIEVIDVIEAFDLGFNLGNVIKYICRCGKKDLDVQELEKAKWYLEREINNRKNS